MRGGGSDNKRAEFEDVCPDLDGSSDLEDYDRSSDLEDYDRSSDLEDYDCRSEFGDRHEPNNGSSGVDDRPQPHDFRTYFEDIYPRYDGGAGVANGSLRSHEIAVTAKKIRRERLCEARRAKILHLMV